VRSEGEWRKVSGAGVKPGLYVKLNQLLEEAGFNPWLEKRCAPYYSQEETRSAEHSPRIYFRMLLVGYFEGIDGQRGIAWRCADSLSLPEFFCRRKGQFQGPPHKAFMNGNGK
jgi:hypothetical protein